MNLRSSSMTTASLSCIFRTSTNNCLEDTGHGEDDVGKRAASGDEAHAAGTGALLEAELATAKPAPRQPPERKRDAEEETPECSVHSLSDSDDEEFIELEGGRFGGGGGEEEDGSASSRERDDEGGVSAVELQRRLHELRHRQDRERITALEAALRRTERRLMENTVTLALGQPAPRRDGQ
ncbi:unnamed protein product [Urochloa humidicola]